MDMKKIILTTGLVILGINLYAQSISFSNGQVTYNFPATNAGEMIFNGNNVTVSDKAFNLQDWSRINVEANSIADNTVEVCYSEVGATVTIAGNIARYVEASGTGA